jgi:hypothetical protein
MGTSLSQGQSKLVRVDFVRLHWCVFLFESPFLGVLLMRNLIQVQCTVRSPWIQELRPNRLSMLQQERSCYRIEHHLRTYLFATTSQDFYERILLDGFAVVY